MLRYFKNECLTIKLFGYPDLKKTKDGASTSMMKKTKSAMNSSDPSSIGDSTMDSMVMT